MKNLRKSVFVALGAMGLPLFALADPSPVRVQLMNYFVGTSAVGVDAQLVSSGVTGTYQFGSLGLPSNTTNFSVFQSSQISESFNPGTKTITANYLTSDPGSSVTYSYQSALSNAPGSILTSGTSSAGNYVEFKPADTIFTPAGTQYTAEVDLLGTVTQGAGLGHFSYTAAPGLTLHVVTIGNGPTVLEFSTLNTPANFAPNIDVKYYTSTPDPAVYMGLGLGLVGLLVKKRRKLAA